MATAPTDPKSVLAALLEAGAALPFSDAEVATARGLAQAPAQAAASEVESLPDPLALAVLEAAVRTRSAALPEALARSSNKPLAKAAKKALYQLRSSGVAVARPARASEPSSSVAAAQEEVPPTLLSALTGTGERAMILARPVRGGLETAHLVFSDERGVTHLSIHEASRGMYRKQLKEVRAGRTPPAVELTLEEAKERLAGAVFLNERSNTARPEGLTELLRHLEVVASERPLSIPEPTSEDAAQDERGAALHEEKELSEWLPDEPQLRALASTWEGLGPEGRLDRPRVEQLFHEAAEAYFTPPLRALYAQRLWEMAAFFERTGRADAAELAQSQARLLAHAKPLPHFAQQLFVKVIRLTEEALAASPGMGAIPSGLRPPPASVGPATLHPDEG
jgi:hypothetical protein